MKRRWMWVVAAGIAAIVVVLGWLGPYFGSRHLTGPASSTVPNALGTAGRTESGPVDVDVAPATIREIETITGAVDGHELIGRRVDLNLQATGVTNKGAFWVGSRDNHVLVAPSRDARTQSQPVGEAERVTISGTIEPVPNAKAKERLSWGLTAPDLVQLSDQKIYIRADRVTPE
jgi:hypothetical protein